MTDDDVYKMAVEVLIPLNHNRYKDYFTQFIVLHFGLFASMRKEFLPGISCKVPFLCAVGMLLSYFWFLTLYKIYADITNLSNQIEKYENKDSKLEFKISESNRKQDISKLVIHSGIVMMGIPILIGVVYFIIFTWSV